MAFFKLNALKEGGVRLREAGMLLVKALALTLASGLIGLYSPSEPYHYVKNGLPLPFLTQIIDVKAAKYVDVRLDPLFLFLDVLAWAGLILLLGFFARLLKRMVSPSRVE
ncbi:MAG: hypothetical protein HA496_01210 [Thaumarchaeota archaeon]|nr:hypothetical protein [Nitrososphaerota archaeon]